MDFDSSTKFISSLAKFLQSLCNGYVEFDSGVEVIGHIYLSVDTGKKIDYILNEKVCKTDENSVTFISNSFHAQPAEKPKPPPPKPIKNPEKEEKTVDDDDIILMDEPESTNTGTVPVRDNSHQQNNVPQSNFNSSSGASKRPYNQQFPSSRASKHRRIDSPSVSNPNGAPSNSHESNDSSFNLTSEMSNVTAASESDLSHLTQVLSGNNSSNTEERDVKPVLDSDMNVVNVKQEYDPSAEVQDSNNMYNEQQDDGSYYSGMESHDQSYDMGSNQYYGGRRGTLHSEYGEMGSGEIYQGGTGPGDSMMGDSQGQVLESSSGRHVPMVSDRNRKLLSSIYTPLSSHHLISHSRYPSGAKSKNKYNFVCEICHKRLPSRREYAGHMNGKHLGKKPFACEFCGRRFAYVTSLPMHRKTCPGIMKTVSSGMSSTLDSTTVPPSSGHDFDNRYSSSRGRQPGTNIDIPHTDVVPNQEAIGSDTDADLKVEFLYQNQEEDSQG